MDRSVVSSPLIEIADALQTLVERRIPAKAGAGGPLPLAAERRAHVRRRPMDLPRPMVARLKHGPVLTLVDVSEGGALVETPARLNPGAQVVLEFLAPSAQKRATMPSRVLRSQVTAIDSRGLRYRGSFAFRQLLQIGDLAPAAAEEQPLPDVDATALAEAILSMRTLAASSRDGRVAKLLDDVIREVQLCAGPTALMRFVEDRLRRAVPLLAVVFGPRPRVRGSGPCESLAFELGHAAGDALARMHVEFKPACALDDGQVRLLHVGASVMSLVYTWGRSGGTR
jgi:hypothetical protein